MAGQQKQQLSLSQSFPSLQQIIEKNLNEMEKLAYKELHLEQDKMTMEKMVSYKNFLFLTFLDFFKNQILEFNPEFSFQLDEWAEENRELLRLYANQPNLLPLETFDKILTDFRKIILKSLTQKSIDIDQFEQKIIYPYANLIKPSDSDHSTIPLTITQISQALNRITNQAQKQVRNEKFQQKWKKWNQQIEKDCNKYEEVEKSMLCSYVNSFLLCVELLNISLKNLVSMDIFLQNTLWIPLIKDRVNALLEKYPNEYFIENAPSFYKFMEDIKLFTENVLTVFKKNINGQPIDKDDLSIVKNSSIEFEKRLKYFILGKDVIRIINIPPKNKLDFLKSDYNRLLNQIEQDMEGLSIKNNQIIAMQLKGFFDMLVKSKQDVLNYIQNKKKGDDVSDFYKKALDYALVYMTNAKLVGYFDFDYRMQKEIDSLISELEFFNGKFQKQKQQKIRSQRVAQQLLMAQGGGGGPTQSRVSISKKKKKSIRETTATKKKIEIPTQPNLQHIPPHQKQTQTKARQIITIPNKPSLEISISPSLIPNFDFLDIRRKPEQTDLEYQTRNHIIRQIKNFNKASLYQQMETMNLIDFIWQNAKNKNFIFLVDVSNLFGKYTPIQEFSQLADKLYQKYKKEPSDENSFFVFVNQGNNNNKETLLKVKRFEPEENYMILEVACNLPNPIDPNRKQCYKQKKPNPMDDFVLLILEKGLIDKKEKTRISVLQKIAELRSWLEEVKEKTEKVNASPYTYVLANDSNIRKDINNVNKKIKKLEKIPFPIIQVLSGDQYSDFVLSS